MAGGAKYSLRRPWTLASSSRWSILREAWHPDGMNLVAEQRGDPDFLGGKAAPPYWIDTVLAHLAPTRSRVIIAATIRKGTLEEFLFLYFRPCSAKYFLSFSRCTTVRWVLIFSQLGPSRGYQRRMTAQASRSTAGTRNHARTMPASAEALCMPFANDWS